MFNKTCKCVIGPCGKKITGTKIVLRQSTTLIRATYNVHSTYSIHKKNIIHRNHRNMNRSMKKAIDFRNGNLFKVLFSTEYLFYFILSIHTSVQLITSEYFLKAISLMA